MKNTEYGGTIGIEEESFYRAAPTMVEQFKEEQGKEAYKEKLAVHWMEHGGEWILGMLFACCMVYSAMCVMGIIRGIYFVTVKAISISFIGSVFFTILPFLLWVWATYYDWFNYENRKVFFFKYAILNFALTSVALVEYFGIAFVTPWILKIPTSTYITEVMVLNLARYLIGAGILGLAFYFIYHAICWVEQELFLEELLYFRIKDYWDFRKNKEFLYDATFITRLDTGISYTIKERDRMLHTLLDGTTGTGKTSSCITVTVANDMDQKINNETHQQKVVLDLVKRGAVAVLEVESEKEFFLGDFKGITEEGIKKLEELKEKAPTAGITVMSPNDGLSDDIYALAKARGLKCNRLDPTLDHTTYQVKEGYVGFNPLYISPGFTPMMRTLEVVKKARVLADVMQALYEMGGKGDPYFTSLNRNITTCVTILILLTYDELHRKYPDKYVEKIPMLKHVQAVINEFSLATEYVDVYEDVLLKKSVEERGFEKDTFSFVITLVKNDLLGGGRDKMFDQARGLRVMFNEFLTNPLYKNCLCCEDTIDLDEVLLRGEVTVINYALELGQSDAMAFGLFFALSFNNAVLRRTKETRIPHFFSIDEFPVILSPQLEAMFTLYRQYEVAMCVAIQTLDQMEKNETTRYFKGVLQGNCAHQIIFGRISATEMKLYEELSGMRKEIIEQETVSQSTITDPDTSLSYSVRTTPTESAVISGGKMRNLHFQEVTVFSVNEGSPIAPFFGKVFFLKKEKKEPRVRFLVDWSPYLIKEEQPLMKECGTIAFHEKKEQTIFLNSGRISYNTKKFPEDQQYESKDKKESFEFTDAKEKDEDVFMEIPLTDFEDALEEDYYVYENGDGK